MCLHRARLRAQSKKGDSMKMTKALVQVALGTLFLMLACAAPGRAQGSCTSTVLGITLQSATVTGGNGTFAYNVNLSASETPCFVNNMDFNFTSMVGVTGAEVVPGSELAGDGGMTLNNFNSTSAEFQLGSEGGLLFGGNNGTLQITCSSCSDGMIDWSISATPDPSGMIAGPSALVSSAPEPGTTSLLAFGLISVLGMSFVLKRREAAVM
jgi:hypothetical protein